MKDIYDFSGLLRSSIETSVTIIASVFFISTSTSTSLPFFVQKSIIDERARNEEIDLLYTQLLGNKVLQLK